MKITEYSVARDRRVGWHDGRSASSRCSSLACASAALSVVRLRGSGDVADQCGGSTCSPATGTNYYACCPAGGRSRPMRRIDLLTGHRNELLRMLSGGRGQRLTLRGGPGDRQALDLRGGVRPP